MRTCASACVDEDSIDELEEEEGEEAEEPEPEPEYPESQPEPQPEPMSDDCNPIELSAGPRYWGGVLMPPSGPTGLGPPGPPVQVYSWDWSSYGMQIVIMVSAALGGSLDGDILVSAEKVALAGAFGTPQCGGFISSPAAPDSDLGRVLADSLAPGGPPIVVAIDGLHLQAPSTAATLTATFNLPAGTFDAYYQAMRLSLRSGATVATSYSITVNRI